MSLAARGRNLGAIVMDAPSEAAALAGARGHMPVGGGSVALVEVPQEMEWRFHTAPHNILLTASDWARVLGGDILDLSGRPIASSGTDT
jgi:hypothetical protein